MKNWRENFDVRDYILLKDGAMPRGVRPMLATLTKERFSSPEWLFERKLDGERCIVFRDNDQLQLLSRNKQNLNDTYPELVAALRTQSPAQYILDGEIVAFEGNATSFSRLQKRIGMDNTEEALDSTIKVYFYLFDILYLDGYDTTSLILSRRKALLKNKFTFTDPLRFTDHQNTTGEVLYKHACNNGWEGLIAKRIDSRYSHGRSRDWLKFKCVNRQELVIAGYTDPRGTRPGFGALLLGYYENEYLRYAGRVGTGFDEQTLRSLSEQLKARGQATCPYAEQPEDACGDVDIHWVTPRLVAEINFTEWTADGLLRHPSFLGLRNDKAAHSVVRETAE